MKKFFSMIPVVLLLNGCAAIHEMLPEGAGMSALKAINKICMKVFSADDEPAEEAETK